MHTTPESQSLFLRILNQENEQAENLLDLLEQEFELLKSAPGKSLQSLLSKKKQQLKTVEQSALAHQQFLQQQDLTNDRRGTESYLEACRDNPSLTAAWQRYLELLQACQKQNEINGGAVTLNQRQVNQALNLLLGIGDSNKTYGRSGESHPTRPSKTLGKA
jgi:flagellar biosynthesis/type III secretory pathway chaperone